MMSGPLVSFELQGTAPTMPIGYKAGIVAVAKLRVPEGSLAVPVLDVTGSVESDGPTKLIVSTPESWRPLPTKIPQFVMSKVVGTVTLREDKTAEFSVDSEPVSLDLAGGKIQLVDWVGHLNIDTAKKTDFRGIIPIGSDGAFRVKAAAAVDVMVGGKIRLGGANGLEASITASISTGVPSVKGSVKHTGGWTPFSGEIAKTLVTPSFDGKITLGVGGKLWSVHAKTEWNSELDLLPFAATQGFLKMQGQGKTKGPGLELHFTQATAASAVEYKGRVTARLLIGGDRPLPPLDLSGDLFPSAHTTLTLSKIRTGVKLGSEAINRWTPLPELLSDLQFPDFTGRISLEAHRLNCDVASQPTSLSLAGGKLELINWVGKVHIDAENLKLQASATGSVRIGGQNGIVAGITAALQLEPTKQGATVALTHQGGWTPFPGSIGDHFKTPAFSATLAIGGFGATNFIRLNAAATWSSALTLLPGGYLKLAGLDSAPGPSMALKLTQKKRTSDAVDYTVTITGTLHLAGTNPINGQVFPAMKLSGPLYSTNEKCILSITNLVDVSYKPLKGLVDDFRMSGMAGEMLFNGGSVTSYVKAAPVSIALAGGYLELLNWVGKAEVDSQTVKLTASATGSVRLGGAKGIEANIVATIDTAAPKAEVVVSHTGGWMPFPAQTAEGQPNLLAQYFKTPPISGQLKIGGGALISLAAGGAYAKPIVLIPGGYATLVHETDNEKGPSLKISMTQASLHADKAYSVVLNGRLKWNLPETFEFPDLNIMGPLIAADKALRDGLNDLGTRFSAGNVLNGVVKKTWAPLGPLMAKLKATGVSGGVKLTKEGAVQAEMGADVPVGVTVADGMLDITNFKPILTADSSGNVKVGGDGSARIGGTGGLEASMLVEMTYPKFPIPLGGLNPTTVLTAHSNTSLAATPPPSAKIRIKHAGGWKPFGDLIPVFKTPAFDSQIVLGGAASTSSGKFQELVTDSTPEPVELATTADATRLAFEKKLSAASPIVLGGGILTLTGASAETGPEFVVSLHQTPGKQAIYGAYFESVVCLPLSTPASCFKMQASAKANAGTAVMELNAPMVLVAPPSGGTAPTESKPLATIPDLPDVIKNALVIPSSSTNLMKLTIDVAKKAMRFDMGALMQVNIPQIGNLKEVSLRVQGKGYGHFKDGKMGGVFVVSFPPGYSPFAYAEGSDAFKRLKQFTGMPISLAALEGLPIAVFGDKTKAVHKGVSFHYQGNSPFPELCPKMDATFSLASLTDIKLDATCPTDAKYTFQSVPSLNFVQMKQISISAGLSAVTLAFKLGTKLQIATGASTCAPSTVDTDAKCLTADLSVGLALTPLSMVFGVSASMAGVWFDPLGLRNFALANPSLAIDLKLTPTISYFKKVSWTADLYWKRPTLSAWHSTLYDKTKSDVTSGLLTLSSALVYEQAPHGDSALSALGLPAFGAKLQLTKMTLTDILGMGADLAQSAIAALNGAIPAASQVRTSSISLPTSLTSAASEFRNLLAFEFTGEYYFSLTKANGFTKRGIQIDCKSSASAIRGISFDLSVLVDVTACLPGDPASCGSTSLAATNATHDKGADGVLLAPGALSQLLFARRIKNMISDPTVKFEAKGSLPLLGSMTFTGELSKTRFLLAATRSMDFFGIIATNYRFEIGLDQGDFALTFSSDDRIFGFRSRASGTIQSESTPHLRASLKLEVGDPFTLVPQAPNCAECAAKSLASCPAAYTSGCMWDVSLTTTSQCSGITSYSRCNAMSYVSGSSCSWSGSYWYGSCIGTYTSLDPKCRHWMCTAAGKAASSLVDNGKFKASMEASFALGGTASIKASVLWEPPTAMVSAFSLKSSYKFDTVASAVASGLQATFPLPAPIGNICLRFAAGKITQCPTAGSTSAVALISESKAEPNLFLNDANRTTVLAERASMMLPGDFMVVYK